MTEDHNMAVHQFVGYLYLFTLYCHDRRGKLPDLINGLCCCYKLNILLDDVGFLRLLLLVQLFFSVGVVRSQKCFLFLQILEAFSSDDSLFVHNCSQLISQSDRVVTMPQYEFRQICDTKLESIRRRISSYQQVRKMFSF